MRKLTVNSLKEVKGLAKELGKRIKDDVGKSAVIVALEGPLGVGKTTLTRELGKVMQINTLMTSPTYVLHRPYKINFKNFQGQLEHIDAYRMEEWGEMEQIGLINMIDQKAIIVIEWADKFKDELTQLTNRAKLVWIKLDYGDRENTRIVEVET